MPEPRKAGAAVPARLEGQVSTQHVRGEKLRVLVVEDDLDGAESLMLLLQLWGYESRGCTSGGEALALAPNFEPHVILTDIGLPDMTGWELAQRLLSSPLLIAITAHGEAADFRRSERAGIRYHLVKPAFQNQLREILERVASGDR